jgi:hypothetical protein
VGPQLVRLQAAFADVVGLQLDVGDIWLGMWCVSPSPCVCVLTRLVSLSRTKTV